MKTFKQLNRAAIREAIRNDVRFTWYQKKGDLKHNTAICTAIAANVPFSYILQNTYISY
jgi:hypothetical protein